MSERYLVVAEFPLVVAPLSLLLSTQPFIRNYRWHPERGVRFHVFAKDGGERITTAETDAAFAFHHVNAYEPADELSVDLVHTPMPASSTNSIFPACAIELPRIDVRHAGKAYSSVWGNGNHMQGDFLDNIVRINTTAGAAQEWWEEHCYPGEPVFVARPASTDEGDGDPAIGRARCNAQPVVPAGS